MKKILTLVTALVMLLTLTTSVFAADFEHKDSGSIGGFNVDFKQKSPEMDGVIGDGEYYKIDLSDISKYYNFSWGATVAANNKNIVNDLKDYAKNKLDVYSCWDGKYFYLAFVADAPMGEYNCSPSTDVYLFRGWCMQVSVNTIDASGTSKNEVGIGVDENDGTMRATSWAGNNISLVANKDYAAVWNRETEKITYEIRIDLAKALGLTADNDARFLMAFCLCMGDGVEANDNGTRQIEFCGGICSSKTANTQGVMTLKGAPEGFVPGEVIQETISDEDQPYADIYLYTDDFRIEENKEKLNLSDGKTKAEYNIDNDGDCYVRITAGMQNGWIGGNKLTGNVNCDGCKAFAIKYRTSSEKITKLGVNATNSVVTKLDEAYKTYCYYKLINDGEWHIISFDMNGFDNWTQFNTGLYLYPFDDEGTEGESLDIMWIKYYTEDRAFDDNEHTEPLETEFFPDDETEPVEDKVTTVDTTAQKDDTTKADKNDGDKDGNNTVLIVVVAAVAVIVVVVVVVAVVVVKNKKK